MRIRFFFWMILSISLVGLLAFGRQSAATPTYLPPIVVSFYHLRIKYTSTPNWAEVEFLNPARILSSQLISVSGSTTIADVSLPFLRLNRPIEAIGIEPNIVMTVDLAIADRNLDEPIKIQSKHGAIGGSGLKVYYLVEEGQIPLKEIDHYWLDPQNPDTSAALFNIDLQPLLNTVSPTQKQIQRSVPDKMLWAVYYPWIAWNQNASCTDHPLYPYMYNLDGSCTLATFSRAIDQAKSAGIDGFFVSYLNSPEIDRNLSLLLEAAQAKGFHIAIYLESTPDPNDRTVNPEMIKDWLVHAITTFGANPAYMQANDRPLILVYNSGAASLSVWLDIFDSVESLGLRAFYIGMSYNVSDLDLFDGLHQYAIFGYSDLAATYSAVSKAVRYNWIWEDTQEREPKQKIFVATVQPGFNNCPYGEDPPFVVERNDGAFFRSTFNAATQSDPDWIMITSWNEFGEDTHIEPSEHYGNKYLEITREYAEMWKGTELPGNVNGNLDVDLGDAILALQVLCGMSPTNVNLHADIDSDGKIGMAEAIYVMQVVAGLRAP